MKQIIYTVVLSAFVFSSCKKDIDLNPQSNLSTATYYSNYEEVKSALTGCYNGLQKPLYMNGS